MLADAPTGIGFDEIADQTHGNRGYLRVALRLLVSCGWMAETGDAKYALTTEGKIAVWLAPLYSEAVSFIPKAIFLDDFLFGNRIGPSFRTCKTSSAAPESRWGVYTEGNTTAAKVHRRTARYLDGMLIGPSMVALAREGIFDLIGQASDGVDPKEAPGNPRSLACVFELLESEGWLERVGNRLRLTSQGRYAAQIASSYGVTVSYLPLFEMLGTLLFGNAEFPRVDESGGELLVNRGMNVWGSGGAHNNYFRKSDEIIIELFNRPLDQQPLGVCDMGCGDGSLLAHVYSVVKEKTLRGAALDARPLILVGADVSKVARRISKQRLRKAGIPNFHVIQGDINRPAYLASELERLGLDIHDLLHLRSFLDHNRPYLPPANYICGSRQARTSGAFAYLGEEIPPDELEENLVAAPSPLGAICWAVRPARYGTPYVASAGYRRQSRPYAGCSL